MKTFALALGGGGARGLAQIAVIEALDAMDVKPVAFAGTSIGALIGAAYASGMSGKAMRRHVIDLAHNRGDTIARLMTARIGRLADLWPTTLGNPLLIELRRCQSIGAAGASDPDCLRAWGENRRRFLAPGARPAARIADGTSAKEN